ncbi:DNA-directed RNA polymerase V subunit 7-like [Prunus yedoensis var. nudiflora]|uniref:DNA-directed RNA polymerase subunit n=1 Tax=Prunus yedoensis var. nudiflora TaxID=2094558 RepID=A0A314YYF0_PRUYE|nr:DNA-directed RNA polymerase V subunit 7-like [Prunus yedoensis var. nudiflora]
MYFWLPIHSLVYGRRRLEKATIMFLKVQLPWDVVISAESLEVKGLMLQKSIIVRLLDDFASTKATKRILDTFLLSQSWRADGSVGSGSILDVLFPVVFRGITFKLFVGEIAEGVVHKVLKERVLLSCGPVENIYLAKVKMPDYDYVPGGGGKLIRSIKSNFSVIPVKFNTLVLKNLEKSSKKK